MSYGFCYDPYDPGWGGKVQPGTAALRLVTMQRVPQVFDLGILRDKSRCSKRSAHCHGRAWDAGIRPTDVEIGDELAAFFVLPEVAKALGVQRVIWGFGPSRPPKEWDSRDGQRYWSAYSGPHHDDHVHVEQCWEAAKRVTVQQVSDVFDAYWMGGGDDMTPEDWTKLRDIVHEEVRYLAEALLAKPDTKAQQGGAHFGVQRDESMMNVDTKTRSYAKAAKLNTDPPPEPVPDDG